MRYTRSLVAERSSRQVTILQAGCTTAGTDLGIAGLRAAGAEIAVTLVDEDQPVTREAVGQGAGMADCVLGDLRAVPLPQRSYDIVLCALLLHRIQHAELVLDRLVGTLRPGGLADPAFFPPAQAVVARLSGGRLTDAHEELLYVLRKPEDLFARVL